MAQALPPAPSPMARRLPGRARPNLIPGTTFVAAIPTAFSKRWVTRSNPVPPATTSATCACSSRNSLAGDAVDSFFLRGGDGRLLEPLEHASGDLLLPFAQLAAFEQGFKRGHGLRIPALAESGNRGEAHRAIRLRHVSQQPFGNRLVLPVQLAEAGDGGEADEHTSELQSQSNLVCRLLLEKKK